MTMRYFQMTHSIVPHPESGYHSSETTIGSEPNWYAEAVWRP